MAKKQKRSVSSTSRPVTQAASQGATYKPSGSRSLNVEFNPDYGPVKKDLKQLGILAVSFISVLVVLSFFLR